MKNSEVSNLMDDCRRELEQIETLILSGALTFQIVKYLTSYALIKSCGTIEYAYKTIIADVYSGISPQINKFIEIKVRNNSSNPSWESICNSVNEFDSQWVLDLKTKLEENTHGEQIKRSLSSLVTNRNNFAHGKGFTASFSDIKSYFKDASEIIVMLDEIISA